MSLGGDMSAGPGTEETRSELDDRVAIITGGGSGIGEATAKLLASKGLGVAIVGRTPAKLDAVVAEIEAAGGRAWAVPVDLADADAAERIIQAVAERAGRLDVIVNNAAALKVASIQSFSREDFDRHTATNLRAPFFLASCGLPLLRESPCAAIVNISSTIGSPLVKPGHVAYGLTKAGLEYFTRAAAHEFAPYRIRVNCISPGSVVTPIHFEWAPDLEYAKEHLKQRIPLGRMGEPEEIAIWVWQLVSPKTAWCTGATIHVDGGQALGLPEELPDKLAP
jgi:meso-butanediol dehydrogenase/(S,S)-butanediol dehydrogenase/diacetyl reductase